MREFLAKLPEFAESHCQMARDLFGVKLDYSARSIAKLDKMIEEGWPTEPPRMLEPVVLGFGSYLGETVRRLHGGQWGFTEEQGIHLDLGAGTIFPFKKVEKRFLNGPEDSLAHFYSWIVHQLVGPKPRGRAAKKSQMAIGERASGFSQEMEALVDVAFGAGAEWLKGGQAPLFVAYVQNGKKALSLPPGGPGDDVFKNLRRWARENPKVSSCILMGMVEDPQQGPMLVAHCFERRKPRGFMLGRKLQPKGRKGVLHPVGEIGWYGERDNLLR